MTICCGGAMDDVWDDGWVSEQLPHKNVPNGIKSHKDHDHEGLETMLGMSLTA